MITIPNDGQSMLPIENAACDRDHHFRRRMFIRYDNALR